MFVQVIEGRVHDAGEVRGHLETWIRDLAPGATGWLGSTAGVTDDGTFIAVARFESEAAATANSERPEQGAWWSQIEKAFDGDVTFTNCPVADLMGAGGSDTAGFVQIIMGRGDRSAIQPLADELEEMLRRRRPDVVGGVICWPGDGSFVQVIYFTSESEARANEASPPSAEDQAAWDRLASLLTFERYLDLNEPWLYTR